MPELYLEDLLDYVNQFCRFRILPCVTKSFVWKVFGFGFEIICKRYNHSSPAITMRYLGIEDKEVNGILLNNEIG